MVELCIIIIIIHMGEIIAEAREDEVIDFEKLTLD